MSRRPATVQFDQTTPLLVLKTCEQPLHYGTLGVIRSLGRVGVPVYSSRDAGPSPAAASRYLRKAKLGVLSQPDPEANIAVLKAFQRRIGRPMMVLPVDDKGALFVAEHAEALGSDFLLPAQKPGLPRLAASKANNPKLCTTVGAATPRIVALGPTDDPAAAQAIRYPAVVKVAQPWLLPPGFRSAVLARTPADVADYRSRLREQSPADIVVQEYIPQDLAEDWFYHGYHREGGEAVVGFTGRKLRSYPPFFGATSYGVSIVNEEVSAISRKILRKLGYAGIVELEFRFDRRDRKYKFVDFNPRLGAQFQFLRNDRGIDVVRAMHLDLTGREVPRGRQVEDCAFVSDFKDVAAFLPYWRSGAVSPAEWLRQVLTAQEHTWFALDDLAPFVAAFGHSAKQIPSALMRRARRDRDEIAPGQRPARPPLVWSAETSREADEVYTAPCSPSAALSSRARKRSPAA